MLTNSRRRATSTLLMGDYTSVFSLPPLDTAPASGLAFGNK